MDKKAKYISFYTSEEFTLEELTAKYRANFESDAAFRYFLRKHFRCVEASAK